MRRLLTSRNVVNKRPSFCKQPLLQRRTVALQEHKGEGNSNHGSLVSSIAGEEGESPLMNKTLGLIAGSLLAGLGYYLLHEDVWEQSVSLAQEITSLTRIKTKQQLEKEEAERVKREELQMLEKRASGASDGLLLGTGKKESSFEDELLTKFKRSWNRGFQRVAEELATSEKNRQEREREMIKERVYRELEDGGIARERVVIKEIVEVK